MKLENWTLADRIQFKNKRIQFYNWTPSFQTGFPKLQYFSSFDVLGTNQNLIRVL